MSGRCKGRRQRWRWGGRQWPPRACSQAELAGPSLLGPGLASQWAWQGPSQHQRAGIQSSKGCGRRRRRTQPAVLPQRPHVPVAAVYATDHAREAAGGDSSGWGAGRRAASTGPQRAGNAAGMLPCPRPLAPGPEAGPGCRQAAGSRWGPPSPPARRSACPHPLPAADQTQARTRLLLLLLLGGLLGLGRLLGGGRLGLGSHCAGLGVLRGRWGRQTRKECPGFAGCRFERPALRGGKAGLHEGCALLPSPGNCMQPQLRDRSEPAGAAAPGQSGGRRLQLTPWPTCAWRPRSRTSPASSG